MSQPEPELRLPFIARLAFILICIVITIYAMYVLQEVLTLLAFSILIAMLLYPLCKRLERWRVPRVWAIFVCLIVLIAVLSGLVYLTSRQLTTFAADFPRFQQKMTEIFGRLQAMAEDRFGIERREQLTQMRKYSESMLDSSGTIAATALTATGAILSNLALIPLYVFFIMLYRDFFRQFLFKLFANVRKTKMNEILGRIYTVVQSYLVGLFLVIGIVAALNTTGLLILGIDYAPFFGIMAAVLLLIPYIGILIGSLLPMLYALVTKDSPVYALGVAGIFGFVQVLEGNFITPYIVGSKVSINPLAAIVGFILFGQLWGVSGLVLAIPVIAILKVVFDNVEGMKPFGFLLGEPAETRPKENEAVRRVREQVRRFERKVKREVEEVTDN
jgi:predicted PurR-regulated permease PerM